MAAAKANKSPKKKSPPELDYESAMKQVESIVRALESGELDLTESLDQYEQGIGRLKDCHEILEAAEQKISLLSGFDADGNPVTQPMPATQFRSGGQQSPLNPPEKREDDSSVDGDTELF